MGEIEVGAEGTMGAKAGFDIGACELGSCVREEGCGAKGLNQECLEDAGSMIGLDRSRTVGEPMSIVVVGATSTPDCDGAGIVARIVLLE